MTIFTGKTEEMAVATGLKTLATTRDQVTVQVVTAARKGWFGIGRKAAQVDVRLKGAAAKPAPAESVKHPATPATIKATGAQHEPAKPQSPTAKPASQPTVPNAKAQANRQAAIAAVADYVMTIIHQLGIQAQVEVQHPARRQVKLCLSTDKEGLLIGKHGRTINALQSLAQLFLNHHGAAHVVVELDVADYRERRTTTLARLAENTAREVVASGKPIYLDPMPSFERKQIHAALAKNRYVTTYSAGKEPHRAVVIEPA